MTEIVPGTGEADLLAAEPDLGQADTEGEQLGTDYIVSPYGRRNKLGTDYIVSPYGRRNKLGTDYIVSPYGRRNKLGTDYIVSPYGRRNKRRKYGK